MNIQGLDKAKVLAALYNNASPLGFGFLQANNVPMTVEEAKALLDSSSDKYFDYVKGRVMKIRIDGDELDTRLYNRDNGNLAAERAIEPLMQEKE